MAQQAVLPHVLRRDFYSFVAKAFKFMEGNRLDPDSRYIEYVSHVLTPFSEGKTKRMLINLPGRHGKTFICSVCLPAFMLGRDPSLDFMIVAYNKSLAEDIVRQIGEIMNSAWYKTVFKTSISRRHAQKDDFAVSGGGRVRAVSIRNVTGTGGDVIIFDDPHNVTDWNNPEKKNRVINEFSTLMTRRNRGVNTQMLVVGHRVAEDDLSAHILAQGKFAHLCLPLFAPEDMEFELEDGTWKLAKGEPLRADAFPADQIEQMRREHRGSPFWLHYQQGMGKQSDDFEIKIGHFPLFSGSHYGLPVVISVDPASKTESISQNVIHVYAVDGERERYILLQVFAETCTFKDLKNQVLRYINRYNASTVLIENTARGPDLIEHLRQERTRAQIVPINPRSSKLERLQACSNIIQAKQVWVKEGQAEDAIDQVVAFPHCPNDDHVDAMTNFLMWVVQQRPAVRQVAQHPTRTNAALALASRLVQPSRHAMINGRANIDSPVTYYTKLGPIRIHRR